MPRWVGAVRSIATPTATHVKLFATCACCPSVSLRVLRLSRQVAASFPCCTPCAYIPSLCSLPVFLSAPQGDVIILGGCVTQLILNAILLYQAAMTHYKKQAAAAAAGGGDAGGAAAALAATDPPAGGAGAARGGLASGEGKSGLRDGEEGSGGAGRSPVPAPA